LNSDWPCRINSIAPPLPGSSCGAVAGADASKSAMA
jgi:hypothetical protein